MIDAPIEQIHLIDTEILRTLKQLPKAKNLDERLALSQIVKNLSDAHASYLDFITTIASQAAMLDEDDDDCFFFEDDDDDDDDFDDFDRDPINFPVKPRK